MNCIIVRNNIDLNYLVRLGKNQKGMQGQAKIGETKQNAWQPNSINSKGNTGICKFSASKQRLDGMNHDSS